MRLRRRSSGSPKSQIWRRLLGRSRLVCRTTQQRPRRRRIEEDFTFPNVSHLPTLKDLLCTFHLFSIYLLFPPSSLRLQRNWSSETRPIAPRQGLLVTEDAQVHTEWAHNTFGTGVRDVSFTYMFSLFSWRDATRKRARRRARASLFITFVLWELAARGIKSRDTTGASRGAVQAGEGGFPKQQEERDNLVMLTGCWITTAIIITISIILYTGSERASEGNPQPRCCYDVPRDLA